MAVIGLDATYLSLTGKGVSRYQHNLIKGIAKLDKKNYYYIFLNKKNILPELPHQDNLHYVSNYIPKKIIWDQFQLPLLLKKYKLDIYHYVSDALPIFSKTKFALLIFEVPDYRIDLLRRSGDNSLYARLSHSYNKFFFRPSLEKAKVIIATSQSTKVDLMQRYGIDERKIHVIYPASEDCFRLANSERGLIDTRKECNAESGYILHITSPDPRDNTLTVIRAFQKAHSQLRAPRKLIIYGDTGLKKMGLERLIKEFNLENKIVFIGRFSLKESERLAALYQAADLYLDPSLYEGFGFQVVEAMSCGLPVVTSNVTSLPEIVGDAGILVSPQDSDSLSSAIIKVLTNPGLQSQMRCKSLERAKFFSWDRTARETLAIYSALL